MARRGPAPIPAEQRFFAKALGTGDYRECWEWGAYRMPNGYGRFDGGLAHRWAWAFFNGPIPDGLHIDHLCRNRACVNPWHLEPVTQRVNTLRGDAPSAVAIRTGLCLNGHERTPENTWTDRRGKSACRACRRKAVA